VTSISWAHRDQPGAASRAHLFDEAAGPPA